MILLKMYLIFYDTFAGIMIKIKIIYLYKYFFKEKSVQVPILQKYCIYTNMDVVCHVSVFMA